MTERRCSRRQLLIGTVAGTLLATGPGTLTGCAVLAGRPPPEPDPLVPPAQRAEADTALARAVAAAHPALSELAEALAGDRRAHAAALRAELHRARPDLAVPAPTAPAPTAPVPGAPPQPPSQGGGTEPSSTDAQARDQLLAAVRAAQTQAAELVPALPGFRAALLASVAACCASHAAVLA